MLNDGNSHFRLQRSRVALPSESDFDPFGGGLDAQSAWKNFGGLELQEAYDLFLTNPICFSEDFTFMGCSAFTYYFPVMDRYVREVAGTDDGDDCEVAILGGAVEAQFGWNGARFPITFIRELEELSEYVRSHLPQYSPAARDHRRILRAWGHADTKIAEYKAKIEDRACE